MYAKCVKCRRYQWHGKTPNTNFWIIINYWRENFIPNIPNYYLGILHQGFWSWTHLNSNLVDALIVVCSAWPSVHEKPDPNSEQCASLLASTREISEEMQALSRSFNMPEDVYKNVWYVFHFVSFISFTLWLQTWPQRELRTAVFSMVSDKHDAWTGLKRQGHPPVYIASPASLGVGCCEYIQRVGIAILF